MRGEAALHPQATLVQGTKRQILFTGDRLLYAVGTERATKLLPG